MRMNLGGAAAALAVSATLGLAACGDDGDGEETSSSATAATADLQPIKDYLTEHTAALVAETETLAELAERYHELEEISGGDYEAMLKEHRDEVNEIIGESQEAFRRANPSYEEMEGIVAGVPALAEYDVILDAGSSAEDDPASAVPFDIETHDGKVYKQPGNFFFLLETSLFGTNPDFAAKGVEPDLDGDGNVEFGEAMPDGDFLVTAAEDMHSYALELQEKAAAFEPDDADAMGAVVIMAPTMSEYFGQWKNTRAIAGDKATEQGFVATSRLSDIADILEGLNLVYDGIEPVIAESDPQQAEQTGKELAGLEDFAADLRDREADGEKFTAEQADLLGSEAQERAEAIAGQISQAAATLNIELPEA